MPAFLKDISPFRGTGENNEKGQSLESFLEEYDTNKYKNPSVTADMIVIQHPKEFTTVEQGLKLLMIKRKNHPCIGFWALPGGFVNIDEDIDCAARRELLEETGVCDVAIEQLCAWGESWRDPRARIITVAYLALIDDSREVQAGDDAADAAWFTINFKKMKEEERLTQRSTVCVVNTYELSLVNEEKNIYLNSTVEMSYNKYGIIKEYRYKVIDNKEIAFDHARFIVQALLYIQNLL